MAAGGGVLAGVATQVQQATLYASHVYLLAAIAGGLGLLVGLWPARVRALPARSERHALNLRAAALAAVCAFALGFGLTGWRACERLAESLAPELVGRDLLLTGCVTDLPQLRQNGSAFLFEVASAQLDGQALAVPYRVPRLISLSWYDQPAEDDDAAPSRSAEPVGVNVQAGQCWRLTARLKYAHGLVNPHGFDAELWWFEQGVRAVGTVRARLAPPQLLQEHVGSPVPRWRQALRDELFARVPDARAAGVLAALSLGDQGAINRDDWTVFRRTGIAHLVSISGLHITMFAWLAQGLIGWLWRRHERLMLWTAAPQAARVGGVLLAWAYAVFSGWGVPAQRTVIMLAVNAAMRWGGVRWPWPMVLGAAAVAVLLFDPWACLQAGFWLSFVAVGLLMASGASPEDAANDRPRDRVEAARSRTVLARLQAGLLEGLRAQAIATVGLAPLTLVFFKQISLVGFAANVVAIPVVSFVITPLAMLGALWTPIWAAGAWVVQSLVALLAWLAGWPWATWNAAAAPLWASALALSGAALLVTQTRWRWRVVAVALVLPLLFPRVPRPAPGHFELVAADIGQGTAVLVRTAHHLLVYDAGPQYGLHGEGGDAGARVLLPLLHARGESRIDMLMLSHRDTDHVGGAGALMRELPPRRLSSSLEPGHPLLQVAQQVGAEATRCAAGQSWNWDGVQFDVLQPEPATAQGLADQQAGRIKPNAMSCVLRVSGASGSALLTGDIERPQELALVSRLGTALRSDLLVVPHHGSQTSSSELFLDTVQPRVAVIQAGYRNRYHHPAAPVVARYRAQRIELIDNASCGAYTWTGRAAVCERRAAPHYWQTSLSPP